VCGVCLCECVWVCVCVVYVCGVCVVCVFVALVIQHAMRMRRVILPSVACPALQ